MLGWLHTKLLIHGLALLEEIVNTGQAWSGSPRGEADGHPHQAAGLASSSEHSYIANVVFTWPESLLKTTLQVFVFSQRAQE